MGLEANQLETGVFLDEGVVLPLYPYSWKPCFPGPQPFLWILSSSIRLPGPNKIHSK